MIEARSEIKTRLNKVFRDVFGDDSIEVFDAMTAKDIEGWDSTAHVVLIVAVEKEFRVKFNAAEIGNLKNVGEILDILEAKSTR